jgi:hypothetical protein
MYAKVPVERVKDYWASVTAAVYWAVAPVPGKFAISEAVQAVPCVSEVRTRATHPSMVHPAATTPERMDCTPCLQPLPVSSRAIASIV